jgi:hypothetical protein
MTSDELIKSVKRRAMIPQNQKTFLDEDFLAFADEEMNLGLVPSVMRMHEDYYLYTEEVTLVEGKRSYSIPYRAIGNKLREVSFQDANGNVMEMTRIGIADVPYYNNSYSSNQVYAYYIANNEVVLVPKDITFGAGTKLLLSYYLRPNSLVMLNQVAAITSIDRTTGTIQVSNLPEDFNINKLVDLVKVKSPHKILDYDIQPLSINSTSKTITLSLSDIPADLEVNDHICLATQSAIPQVPSDLHVVLAHRVATRCLEALGDTEGLAAANQKLAELEQQTTVLIDSRVEDAPKKVVNRHGTLRSGLNSRRYRFRG